MREGGARTNVEQTKPKLTQGMIRSGQMNPRGIRARERDNRICALSTDEFAPADFAFPVTRIVRLFLQEHLPCVNFGNFLEF